MTPRGMGFDPALPFCAWLKPLQHRTGSTNSSSMPLKGFPRATSGLVVSPHHLALPADGEQDRPDTSSAARALWVSRASGQVNRMRASISSMTSAW